MRLREYGCWVCKDQGTVYDPVADRFTSCRCPCHSRKRRPVRLMPLVEAFLEDYNASDLWEDGL
jgi:hypothetical protein